MSPGRPQGGRFARGNAGSARLIPRGWGSLAVRSLPVVAGAVAAVALASRSLSGARQRAASITATGRLLRRVGTSSDPAATRMAVCQAVLEITGAVGAFLLEPDGEGWLVPTSSSTGALPAVRISPAGAAVDAAGAMLETPANGLAIVEAYASAKPVFHSDIEGWSTPVARDLGGVSALWQPVLGETRAAVAVLVVLWGKRVRRVPPAIAEAVGIFADEAAVVIRQADLISRLSRLAVTDSLTGALNIHGWGEVAEAAVATAREGAQPLCFGVLDLDNFSAYNNDWGHEAADRLLRQSASAWREVLGDEGFVARASGDVFRMVLPGHDGQAAATLMQTLRANTPDSQYFSAGLAIWDGAESASALNARAESALFTAKRAGRGGAGPTHVDGDEAGEPQWRQTILDILEHRHVTAVFQPVTAIGTGEIHGYEALARPSGSSAGISVEAMFATAQKMGVGRDLDWICRRAALRSAEALPADVMLFLNISVATLLDPVHGADHTELVLQASERSATTVVLEISEREKIHNLGRLRAVLAEYREAGFRFALDDVGEGHSTVETLAAANPEYVKLARSLLQGAADRTVMSVIRGVLEFARSTGARVLAEGIETEAELELLRELGVDLGQGYLLGRPAPLETWLPPGVGSLVTVD